LEESNDWTILDILTLIQGRPVRALGDA